MSSGLTLVNFYEYLPEDEKFVFSSFMDLVPELNTTLIIGDESWRVDHVEHVMELIQDLFLIKHINVYMMR